MRCGTGERGGYDASGARGRESNTVGRRPDSGGVPSEARREAGVDVEVRWEGVAGRSCNRIVLNYYTYVQSRSGSAVAVISRTQRSLDINTCPFIGAGGGLPEPG